MSSWFWWRASTATSRATQYRESHVSSLMTNPVKGAEDTKACKAVTQIELAES